MTEYWLQKKTLSGWSVVTWYDNLFQAEENYMKCLTNKGYSWRLVKVETVQVDMLDEVVEVAAPELEQPKQSLKQNGWGAGSLEPSQVNNSGWGATPVAGWGDFKASFNPSSNGYGSVAGEHGLSGSVWMVHYGLKKKTRVPASQAEALMLQGYVKGGPQTKFI